MGKYERDWAEKAEIDVTNAINSITSEPHIQLIADKILNLIKDKYSSPIKNAVWIGGENYSDKGDIKVILDNDIEIPVETKFSFENGSGTKANISTTVLKKRIDEDIQSYPQYDDQLGLKNQRYKLVEECIGRPLKNTSDYNRSLRFIRDNNDEKVIEQIVKITTPGQESYARYAAEKMNQKLFEVNNWVDQILAGNNTIKKVAYSNNLVYCVVKKFGTKNQTVEFYNFDDIDSNVTQVISSGKSIKLQNQSGRDVLRLSVTWKNICQGGQTPCFNVFVGNAF